MTIILKGVAGATDYAVDMYPFNSSSIEGAPVSLTEGVAGTFYGSAAGKPANLYVLVFRRDTTEVARATYEWTGTEEATNTQILAEGGTSWATATGFATTEPDNAGIAELTALLTPDNLSFSTVALQNAPTGAGGGSGLTVEQANQLSTLFGLVNGAGTAYTAAALANAPGGAELADITTAVNAARDAVILEGTNSWVTASGFSTVNPDNAGISSLQTAVAAIPTTPLLAVNYVAPDNAAIATASAAATSVDTKLTTARAAKLDDDLSTLAQVNAARDAVLTEGASNWITASGFSTVDPDNSGIAELTALLTVDNTAFTSTALQNAPTGGGGGSGLTPEQSSQLATLFGLVNGAGTAYTAAALANAPGGADLADITASVNAARDAVITEGTNNWITATGFSTVNPDNAAIATINTNVSALPAQINAARDAVITEGTSRWVTATGFATTEPNNAGISALQTAVAAIPTAPLLAADYVAPDNATIGILGGLVDTGSFTAAALANAPLELTPEDSAALAAIPTTNTLSAIAAAVNAARDAVISEGSSNWITATGFATGEPPTTSAIATAVESQLSAELSAIRTAAELSALPLDADEIEVDETTAIATYTKDGSQVARYSMFGALGEPNADVVRRQVKLSV